MSFVSSDDSAPRPLAVAMIGGGSGGHLFPAIAVSHRLLQENSESRILFLVSQRQIDTTVLASVGWPNDRVRVEPYITSQSGGRLPGRLSMIPAAWKAMRSARRTLADFCPDVAIGVGAFASVPGVLAASRRRIPIVLMEHNSVPGKATRLLASRATLTMAGLPLEEQYAARWPSPLVTTGTPLRDEFSRIAHDARITCRNRGRLLILGGSQGARSINRLVLQALADEHCLPSDWEIVHQTGETEVQEISHEYARRGRTARVVSFLPDMPGELAQATMAVSRAGACTLHELSCAGVPSILIPLSSAAEQHQMRNSRLIAAVAGAMVLDETDRNAAEQLRSLMADMASQPELRQRMSQGIRSLARPDAASRVVSLIRSVADGQVWTRGTASGS